MLKRVRLHYPQCMIDGYLDDRGVYTDLDGNVIDLVNRCKPSRVEIISPGMVELV